MTTNDQIRGIGSQQQLVSRFLDTNGDGTGTKNAIGNYSGAVTKFKLTPAAGEIFRVARLIISIEDTNGMTAAEYGNLGSALTNGVLVRVENGAGTVLDLTDGDPIITNAEFGSYCFDVTVKSWGQTPDDDLLVARWTFAKYEQMIRLVGDRGEFLSVVLNDDFSGLIAHKFMAQGYRE